VAAREDFRIAAADARDHLSPDRLKAEATDMATQQVGEAKAALRRTVRRHPLVSWSALAVVATLATYALRPVATSARRAIKRITHTGRRLGRKRIAR
jgi:hypothetical protein